MHETVCQQDFTHEDQKEIPQLGTGTARMEVKSSKIKLTQIKMNVRRAAEKNIRSSHFLWLFWIFWSLHLKICCVSDVGDGDLCVVGLISNIWSEITTLTHQTHASLQTWICWWLTSNNKTSREDNFKQLQCLKFFFRNEKNLILFNTYLHLPLLSALGCWNCDGKGCCCCHILSMVFNTMLSLLLYCIISFVGQFTIYNVILRCSCSAWELWDCD